MTGQERREKILAILEANGSVKSIEIAEEFGVSEKSIRRDLIELENNGLLTRIRGGAKRLENHAASAKDMEVEDAVKSVDQVESKNAARPIEQAKEKEAVQPAKQTKAKEVVQPVDQVRIEDVDVSANQMKLELSEDPLSEPSKRLGSKAKVADESDNKSVQVSPGVVVKTSRPEWIVQAIEKARPGTIVEPVHPVVEKEEAPIVQEKKKAPPTKKKKGVPATKAPESTSEEVEMGSIVEAKEPKKPKEPKEASKEINVIQVGETITPEVLEGLIKLVNPKAKEESELSSEPEEDIQSKGKPDSQRSPARQPARERAKRPEQVKEPDQRKRPGQIKEPVQRKRPEQIKEPDQRKRPEQVKEPDQRKRPVQVKEPDQRRRPERKTREDGHKKAYEKDGTVKSIKKGQGQKTEKPKESSKFRRVFDLIHILLAVICLIGGIILSIYILQAGRNQNVEIEEENGRHNMMICEDLSVKTATQEHMLVGVSDDTVIQVYF